MEKSRVELYELVWVKPMTHLAKELGLSDVGLRKICVKFGISLPPRGHWSRLQFGKQDPRPEGATLCASSTIIRSYARG